MGKQRSAGGRPERHAASPVFTEGWTIGKPDAVATMAEPFNVPATGTIEYQYFSVPTNFTEDKWIQGDRNSPGSEKRRSPRAGFRQ